MGGNFCDVTGQSDWCSSDQMPCHEGTSEENCTIKNWCVCQWAFSSYIKNAGGCDQVQDIVCESINMEAIVAYKGDAEHSKALKCLVEWCGLDESNFAAYDRRVEG